MRWWLFAISPHVALSARPSSRPNSVRSNSSTDRTMYLNDQTSAKADDVRMAGAATHAEENAAATPSDRIAVELK